ncbi:hypothetical protein AQUCO_04600010v1 [Aquilegia coerulea]|uniref:Uncharacterized protein n=1 Tax=Aquilegia coerulea TaxID=218851 RepID=A0A2G5CL43_AQUCA|nr:hypothetical protein AQUCO_04600010v1 [Aquilegia coerulea]
MCSVCSRSLSFVAQVHIIGSVFLVKRLKVILLMHTSTTCMDIGCVYLHDPFKKQVEKGGVLLNRKLKKRKLRTMVGLILLVCLNMKKVSQYTT